VSYSTIVSICPARIKANLPHTTPPHIDVPPGENDKPALAIFSDGSERRYIGLASDEKNPWAEYPVSAENLTKSIVSDFKSSATYVKENLGVVPGVFVLEGKPEFVSDFSRGKIVYVEKSDLRALEWVKKVAPEQLKEALTQQNSWFKTQIQIADRSFAKNNNYAEISDIQRYAAKIFNFDRPWAKDVKPEDFTQCPGCATFVTPGAVICKDCHTVINVDEYKKLNSWRDEKSGLMGVLGASK